ncbi:MAG: triphosphoribosyl-dephospho-CoA synthase [Pirellula sp.]
MTIANSPGKLNDPADLSIGQRVRLAIVMECSAIKAGNVHPQASFADLNYQHFLRASQIIGEQIDQNIEQPVGRMVLECVRSMMTRVHTNTSLGTILLMAPLVSAMHRLELRDGTWSELAQGVPHVLALLDKEDTRDIYAAIGLAKPGGIGKVDSMDIAQPHPESILEAMRFASGWDDVALQFASGFELVFQMASRMTAKRAIGMEWLDLVRCLQIEWMTERIDSLIARKRGHETAKYIQNEAKSVLVSGAYGSPSYELAWNRFDRMLRDPEHRNNPGTTADLIAASLLIALTVTDGMH